MINRLYSFWRPTLELTRALEAHFGAIVSANAYITPPSSTAFRLHWDSVNVFFIQTGGRKRWKVPPIVGSP